MSTSYLSQNLTLGDLRFGDDQLSQQLARAARNAFELVKYQDLERMALPQDTLFQILQIDDVTKSLAQELEQLSELDDEQNIVTDKVTKSRGKRKKVITKVNLDLDQQPQDNYSQLFNKSVHKLLLQDSAGNICYAMELEKLNFLKSSAERAPAIPLGSKIIIKQNTVILRGCLLVFNKNCMFIGGQIPELNRNYIKRRIAKLTLEIELSRQ